MIRHPGSTQPLENGGGAGEKEQRTREKNLVNQGARLWGKNGGDKLL